MESPLIAGGVGRLDVVLSRQGRAERGRGRRAPSLVQRLELEVRRWRGSRAWVI